MLSYPIGQLVEIPNADGEYEGEIGRIVPFEMDRLDNASFDMFLLVPMLYEYVERLDGRFCWVRDDCIRPLAEDGPGLEDIEYVPDWA